MDQNFRHPSIDKKMRGSIYNLISVLDNFSNVLGSLIVKNDLKVHTYLDWIEKGFIETDTARKFILPRTVKGHVRYSFETDLMDDVFFQVQSDDYTSTEWCLSESESVWLSVRCFTHQQDRMKNLVCQNDVWYRNESCKFLDPCMIFYSPSGYSWNTENEAKVATTLTIHTLSTVHVATYASGKNKNIMDFLTTQTGLGHGVRISHYSLHNLRDKLTECHTVRMGFKGHGVKSEYGYPEFLFYCDSSDQWGWFAFEKLIDSSWGVETFKEYEFLTTCDSFNFCIRHKDISHPCDSSMYFLVNTCGTPCGWDEEQAGRCKMFVKH